MPDVFLKWLHHLHLPPAQRPKEIVRKDHTFSSSSPTLAFLYNPFFFFLAEPRSMCDLSSPTWDGTRAPWLEAWSPNHWTAREVPLYNPFYFCKIGCNDPSFSVLILVVWVSSLFFLISLANGLLFLLTFLRNPVLVALIFLCCFSSLYFINFQTN